MEGQRVVAAYKRVSSDDQRERETIRTQDDVIEQYLKLHPEIVVFREYRDDGVSGTIPMAQRPQGRLLIEDARQGRFREVLVTRADRLGRDEIELLQLYALFGTLGVTLTGVAEPIGDQFSFGIKAIVSADERRRFLARSAEGMERAAREGRYCGGIVPLGYRVEGTKHTARLVISNAIIWRTWTEANLVREIFGWLVDGWSCRKVADHLNALGVPTAYAKDGRCVARRKGERRERTAGIWRPSRIRGLIVKPTYKGESQYGRRSKTWDQPIVAQIPALVTRDVWEAAQQALVENRIIIKHRTGVHLLCSLVKCGVCGLNYTWTAGSREKAWYRCNGAIAYRGRLQGRCPGKSIRFDYLDLPVWQDVERFLHEPGDIIEELAGEQRDTAGAAAREAERLLVEGALADVPEQRNRILDLYRKQKISEGDFDAQMDEIVREERILRDRLAELAPSSVVLDDIPTDELLCELRRRLDADIDDEMKQEIIRLLVRQITVHTEIGEDGKKHARIVIEYKFPAVADDLTGTDWRRRSA